MSASIVIDDGFGPVIGSVDRDNTFLATLFTLSNFDNTGVLAWNWLLRDKPIGSAAVLSSTVVASPTITPDVEGTYVIELKTFLDLAATDLDDMDVEAIGIRFIAPFDWRIPGATETLQFSPTTGWAKAVEEMFRDLSTLAGGGGLQGAYDSGGTGQTITTDAQGSINFIRGALTVDAEELLFLSDANANPGRTAVMVLISDGNVIGAGDPDTVRVARSVAGGRAIRSEVFAAGDVAYSAGLVAPSTGLVIFGDGDTVIGASVMSGTEKFRVVGDARVEGKLTVTGLIDPTGLVLDEQATVPGGAPAAGKGTIWVRNDAPNVLVFTDDGGTDRQIAYSGSGSDTLQSAYDNGSSIITTIADGAISITMGAAVGAAVQALIISDGGGVPERTAALLELSDIGNATGPTLLVQRTTTFGSVARFYNSEDGPTGVVVDLFSDGATPAVDEALGVFRFIGNNTTPAQITYGEYRGVIQSAVPATAEFRHEFHGRAGGLTLRRFLELRGATDAAEAGALFYSRRPAGAIAPFILRASANFAAGEKVFIIQDTDGASELFSVEGDGKINVPGAIDPSMLVLNEQSGDPPAQADKAIFYSKEVATITEGFVRGSSGAVVQVTSNGRLGGGDLVAGGEMSYTSVSPATLAMTEDDYAGANGFSFARLTPPVPAGSTVTGIVAGSDGQHLIIANIGSVPITFNHEDAGSVAANRLILAGSVPASIGADLTIWFVYDGTTARWRQVSV